MSMIRTILWDVDGTLLSFKLAERAAMRACFAAFGLGELTDGMLAEYSAVNAAYWKRLERGELTRQETLRGRFLEFFAAHGIPTDCVDRFNEEYQIRLGDTVVFNDGADAIVRFLRGRVRQYAVTNGTLTAQRRKLARSGLDQLLDGVFISEQVGAEKPGRAFFDAVLAAIPACDPHQILIVGDSLTSDMQGGNNAGILCCWYAPEGGDAPEGLCLDYIIKDLNEVVDIVDGRRTYAHG